MIYLLTASWDDLNPSISFVQWPEYHQIWKYISRWSNFETFIHLNATFESFGYPHTLLHDHLLQYLRTHTHTNPHGPKVKMSTRLNYTPLYVSMHFLFRGLGFCREHLIVVAVVILCPRKETHTAPLEHLFHPVKPLACLFVWQNAQVFSISHPTFSV